MTHQRDLFGRQPGRATPDARRSIPKQPMMVEPFNEWDEDRMTPRGIENVPEWLRLPTDEPL